MEPQLSGLQKMFCQLSKSVNVNKRRFEPYTGVPFSDSKLTHPKQSIPTSHTKKKLKNALVNETASVNF